MSRKRKPLIPVDSLAEPEAPPAPPVVAPAPPPVAKAPFLTGFKKIWMNRYCQSILTILLMVGVGYILFIYYQSWYARKVLLGWWHIFDNVYMVIDGSVVQFGEFSPDPLNANGPPVFNIYHQDDNVDFSYKFHVDPNSDSFKMTRSTTNPIKLGNAISHPFNSKEITLRMHVDIGLIIVKNDEDIEQARLTKNNEMTNEYTKPE